MFSLKEHGSWQGYLGNERASTDSLATVLSAVHVADKVTDSGRRIEAELRESRQSQELANQAIIGQLSSVNSNVKELNATTAWGFQQTIASIAGVSDSLEELIKVAKTPSQTWAFEQFDLARQAIRRNLVPEALEYLDRAIYGHQSNPGNKLDHRFHYLKGSILLGSSNFEGTEYVDVPAARGCFETAAKYAHGVSAKFEVNSLCCAAFAAYAMDDIDGARAYLDKALALKGDHGEANYLLAKISAEDADRAAELLLTATKRDVIYAARATTDRDFQKSTLRSVAERYNADIDEFFEAVRRKVGSADVDDDVKQSLLSYAEKSDTSPESNFARLKSFVLAFPRVVDDKLVDMRSALSERSKVARKQDGPLVSYNLLFGGAAVIIFLLVFLGGDVEGMGATGGAILNFLLAAVAAVIGGLVISALIYLPLQMYSSTRHGQKLQAVESWAEEHEAREGALKGLSGELTAIIVANFGGMPNLKKRSISS